MTSASASPSDLLRWRMHALGLAGAAEGGRATAVAGGGSTPTTPTTIVEHLGAMQGQDWHASLWAIGVRAPETTRQDVLDALRAGEIVRSWPMRGTVHLTTPADLGWIQRLTEPSAVTGLASRREYLGLDAATVTRVVDLTADALAGGHAMNRDELSGLWQGAGIDISSGSRYHLIWWMSQTGVIVQGPPGEPDTLGRAAEPRFVLVSEWITQPRNLTGDEALEEIAAMFTRGRGVVRDVDLAWWAGFGKRKATRALELALGAGRVTALESDGVRMYADPATLDSAVPHHDKVLLLPAFDEHLLGFTNRTPQLHPDHYPHIVPGRNGVFRPTIVRGGRTIGTWSAKQLKTKAQITATPFPGERLRATEPTTAAKAWANFHGAPEPEIRLTS